MVAEQVTILRIRATFLTYIHVQRHLGALSRQNLHITIFCFRLVTTDAGIQNLVYV